VVALEPWGIAIAVVAVVFSLFSFQTERLDREEDRINRAITQLSSGHGRHEAMSTLVRNGVDFRQLSAKNAYLPAFDFSGLDLSGVDFEGAFLIGAIFDNTILSNTNFAEAILEDSSFNRATLGPTDFRMASLNGASFENALFKGIAGLTGASFENAQLFEASFKGALQPVRIATNHGFGSTETNRSEILESSFLMHWIGPEARYMRYCDTIMPDGSLCSQCAAPESGLDGCPYLPGVDGSSK